MTYGTLNNRLLFYEIRDTMSEDLLETVWNQFDAEGKITRVIRKLESESTYRATRMIYNGGKQVEYVVGEEWTVEDDAVACEDYCRTFVWRYRYDGPRQRYMRQKLDPDNVTTVLETSWSDYDGTEVYTDFHVDSGDHVIDRAYETAFGEFPDPDSGTTSIEYYHRDQIGSTRVMTCDTNLNNCTAGGNGQPPITRRRVYTAFGEEVSTSGSVDSRYRYAGVWGYQSHDDFSFLHVGARWYDPETGRFLQRDPIGISGGMNVYGYALNNPASATDPDGLRSPRPGPSGGGRGAWRPYEPPGFKPPFVAPDSPGYDWESRPKYTDNPSRDMYNSLAGMLCFIYIPPDAPKPKLPDQAWYCSGCRNMVHGGPHMHSGW